MAEVTTSEHKWTARNKMSQVLCVRFLSIIVLIKSSFGGEYSLLLSRFGCKAKDGELFIIKESAFVSIANGNGSVSFVRLQSVSSVQFRKTNSGNEMRESAGELCAETQCLPIVERDNCDSIVKDECGCCDICLRRLGDACSSGSDRCVPGSRCVKTSLGVDNSDFDGTCKSKATSHKHFFSKHI